MHNHELVSSVTTFFRRSVAIPNRSLNHSNMQKPRVPQREFAKCICQNKAILEVNNHIFIQHICSCGLVYVQMLQLLPYFFSAEVESTKDITFTLAKLWNIIQLFSGIHGTKVIFIVLAMSLSVVITIP